MKKDKVAIFCPSLQAGGGERAMLNLALGFAEQDWSVDLVLIGLEGHYVRHIPRGVNVVDLHARRVLTSLPPFVRYLRRARPCAVVSALDYANVVALWARKLAGIPLRVVVSVQDTLSVASRNSTSIRERAMPLFARMFYPWADAVTAVSQGAADDLARLTGLPGESIHVAPNPVVGPEIEAAAAEPLDHPWFAPGEPPVILAVGRLTRQKDFPTLLRAFGVLRRQQPARLLILGEGEDRAQLEAMVKSLGIEDDVALPGVQDNPYRFMARASAFVLSSAWEGLPTVLIEALAVGTPVVATDCPSGPREILEHGRWGSLVPVGGAGELAAAISKALASPRADNPMDAVRRFTRSESVRQYLALIAGPNAA